MTVAKLLEIIALEGPLSELADRVPQYCQDKRKLACPDDKKETVLRGLVEHYRGERVDTTDGVKILFEGGWTLVRPSGTEPLFRIYSEARTEGEAQKRSCECQSVLEDLLKD